MDRREFLRQAVLLYCAVELPAAYADAPRSMPRATRRPLDSLPAFLDTLIPADSTPSASQLGLDRALARHAQEIENYPRLLELGCAWLDEVAARLHGGSFDGLRPPQQEAVVTLAEASAANSIPRLFFERVRFDLFGLYYASPASWQGLGIASAPQPAGYMDFARPPRTRRG